MSDAVKRNSAEREELFKEAYQKSNEDEHFLKLFNKVGKENIEPSEENEKWFDELKLRISCFFQEALRLNTVSFLFGTGPSIPLGASSIYTMPKSICSKIRENGLGELCKKLVECYPDKTCSESGECKINLETFLGDLIRLQITSGTFKKVIKAEGGFDGELKQLIETIKEELYHLCNVPNKDKIKDEYYKSDPLRVHREFVKKILARPTNLMRANIFTTNYDLAFEKAMDDLGVMYIDGFVGNIRRIFKPEVYNYDYYFPASTTEGKVHRLEKVVHLYKLHGSLNWVESPLDEKNIFGIEQIKDQAGYDKSILIYPQPMKNEETLGFPYSEMFRRFAASIQQPQNVLITYGYGFGDEHINEVIRNAVSISTFQLIIISYNWTSKLKEFYEKVKDDPRISFLIGPYLGDWTTFVLELLPDIKQLEIEEKIVQTMKRLKEKRETEESEEF